MDMLQEIHLWDLPQNNLYIKLKPKFAQRFFLLAHNQFGSWKLLGEAIQIRRGDTILARNWKNNDVCYPLKKIFEIANLLDVSYSLIEKNLLEIKAKTFLNKRGGSAGKPLVNPKFPINITPDFCEMLGHISGDGTISRTNPKKGIALKYINSELTLLNEFKKLINNVFGRIEPNVIIRTDKKWYRRPNYVLQYPTIISYIVLAFWDYRTNDNMSFPRFIHTVDEDCKCAFLRALFDDEGCIPGKRKKIQIGMKPLENIEDIKKLLDSLGIYVKRIERGRLNRLTLARHDAIITFHKRIGFKHPQKKQKLDNIIKIGWNFRPKYNHVIRDWIFNYTNKGDQLTCKILSRKFKFSLSNARVYLRGLESRGQLKSEIISSGRFIRYKEYYLTNGKS